MWDKLFYDKFAIDHHYNNVLTKNTTVEDLEDGSYYSYTGQKAIDFYNSQFKSNFQIPKIVIESDLYKLSIYTKVVDNIDTIYTIINVNTKKLENYVVKKMDGCDELDFLKKLCRYHLSYTNSNRSEANMFYNSSNKKSDKITENVNFMTEKIVLPIDYTFDDKIKTQDDLTIKLFDYQRCSVNWMLNKEKNLDNIYYNINEEVVLGDVYYDVYNQSFKVLNDRKSLKFYGGGLIDEVGLGKTIQILTLSLLNPCESTDYVKKEDETHLYSRATLIICPNQLCGQWEREIQDKFTADYDPQIIKILTKKHFDKYTYQDLLDADFVILSFTFLDNKAFTLPWSEKVSSLKSFSRTNWSSSDAKSISTVFDNMGKELVKNPLDSLMKTNAFYQLINWHRFVVDEFHEVYGDARYTYIKNILPFIKSSYRWCVTATPFIKKDSLYHTLNFLTNFKNTDNENILTNVKFVDYLSTKCFRRNTKDSVKEEHTLPPIEEEIRWLKFSSTERMMYNAYLANPNNDKFSEYLRQLCCHPQLADETKLALSNCKTLKEIETMMISHYKTEVNDATNKVRKIEKRIKKVNKKIKKIEKKEKKKQLKKMGIKMEKSSSNSDSGLCSESGSGSGSGSEDSDNDELNSMLGIDTSSFSVGNINTITMTNLKESLSKLEDVLKLANKELNGKTTTFNFFNNVIERLRKTSSKETTSKTDTNKSFEEMLEESDSDENEDDVCGICLDEIPEDDIGVGKCGHVFCYSCLKSAVSKYHNCPYCKGKLKDDDIYMISFEKKKKNISKQEKHKDGLINEVGTKLANLITYIKESDNHTIIFSQWDDLLRRVGRILAENGIKNVFCKGNCYQRDKAIREFNKDDSIKVIMLSSAQSASGTNLTKASQVILIDPIYGDYTYRKGQEKQAIGRAHRLGQKNKIKLIRFIIKNSVEEEIYWLNHEEDKKHADSQDDSIVKELIIEN
jgi:SNF2 family DNA or RNA helicase